ncbi:MAG TPA: NmrA family NAD(P)-binding protein [Terriglobales bacterium]|nr:NmrA family NAD(P)-binding protein [Terriglobales bacterium]
MYAITGITGQVGGALARALLAAGYSVRAVMRDEKKAVPWAAQGCEIALAAMDDAAALTKAFSGAEGVFILLPPVFDPQPGFPESRAVIAALQAALMSARPQKVVCLSTIGAQAAQPNLLSQLSLLEEKLGSLPLPIAFLRSGWFLENTLWDIGPARDTGTIPSFLQPLDRKIPMVATADVGRVAAELLTETWQGKRVVELEGPVRMAPNDLAAGLARVLGRPVRAEAVPRETWGALFKGQGMNDPLPRIQMLDGFNEGWIDFEGGPAGTVKGKVGLDTVLQDLLSRAG